MAYLRVKEAGELLGIKPVTVRKWCNEGKLECSRSAAGHRLFDEDYIHAKKKELIQAPNTEKKTVFYARTSNNNDISIQNQLTKLTNHYSTPDKEFTDKSSGLNDNRRGLNSLIKYIKTTQGPKTLYITNKDRLTRFGYNYLKELFESHNTEIISLNDTETKEPQEILMQDFMSLIASFSGKFYRLRGWEQQKQLLNTATKKIENRE